MNAICLVTYIVEMLTRPWPSIVSYYLYTIILTLGRRGKGSFTKTIDYKDVREDQQFY